MGLGASIPLYVGGFSGLGYASESSPAGQRAVAAGYYQGPDGEWYGQGDVKISTFGPEMGISQESYDIFVALGYPASQFKVFHPVTCPPAANGSAQQLMPDGQCHPVFDASQYSDPAAELARRQAFYDSGPSFTSVMDYQDMVNRGVTPKPPTLAPTATSTPTGSSVPSVPASGGSFPAFTQGSGVFRQTVAVGGTSIPVWLIAAGAVLVFLAVKK